MAESTYQGYPVYRWTHTPINLVVSLGPASGSNTITASCGANGSITPSGAVTVAYGGSQEFFMAPNKCYKVLDVLVDGHSVLYLCVSVSQGLQYTFENVNVDHTIAASFEPGYCECDLNNDGRCDMRDWVIFGRNWGRTNCKIQ
ncbi:hypothetical protein EG829_17980 [bacterium]|nr:hypothetical protein [bacterium]